MHIERMGVVMVVVMVKQCGKREHSHLRVVITCWIRESETRVTRKTSARSVRRVRCRRKTWNTQHATVSMHVLLEITIVRATRSWTDSRTDVYARASRGPEKHRPAFISRATRRYTSPSSYMHMLNTVYINSGRLTQWTTKIYIFCRIRFLCLNPRAGATVQNISIVRTVCGETESIRRCRDSFDCERIWRASHRKYIRDPADASQIIYLKKFLFFFVTLFSPRRSVRRFRWEDGSRPGYWALSNVHHLVSHDSAVV